MKIAVMQPYVFPYIGYFQLINAVDTFVFYDDVNFIKKGFVNRNAILLNENKHRFVIPCKSISQNKFIKDVDLFFDKKSKSKFMMTMQQAYHKAPFFNIVFPLLDGFVTNNKSKTISEFAIDGVKLITTYLNMEKKWLISSVSHYDSQALKKEHRLIQIAKKENAATYINSIGGIQLYDKVDFEHENITLKFLKSKPHTYKQFDNDFVPWLSIIDVLMFNSIDRINMMLNNYELV